MKFLAVAIAAFLIAGCGARIPVWNNDHAEFALGYPLEGKDSQIAATAVNGIAAGGLYLGSVNYTAGRATGAQNVSRSVTEHLDATGAVIGVTETITLGDLEVKNGESTEIEEE